MKVAAPLLVALSLLLLGAHFLRSGRMLLMAAMLACLALMLLRRPWVRWTLQAVLVLGAAEWIRTLLALAAARLKQGDPAGRMALILGAIAAFTALAALALGHRSARRFYDRAEGP